MLVMLVKLSKPLDLLGKPNFKLLDDTLALAQLLITGLLSQLHIVLFLQDKLVLGVEHVAVLLLPGVDHQLQLCDVPAVSAAPHLPGLLHSLEALKLARLLLQLLLCPLLSLFQG